MHQEFDGRAGRAAVFALAATVACTDWDEGAGGERVIWHAVQAGTQTVDVDAGAAAEAGPVADVFVAWDTWKPPAPEVLIDAGKAEATAPDGGVSDASFLDSTTPDAAAPDPGVGMDAFVPDATVVDAGTSDSPASDVGSIQDQAADAVPFELLPPADGAPIDTALPDNTAPDATVADSAKPDLAETAVKELPPADVPPIDVPAPDLSGGPDGAPDWQGFDLIFPSDAEVFAGVPGDCLSMYLFQSEVCAAGLTNACIDQVQSVGSLWAKTLYQPLADCEKAVCVPKCQGLSGNQCLETCIGKYCATQFLGCVANAKSGAQSCPATFACAEKYPEKLQSIAIFCYSNATPQAQKQFSALIGCTGKPQTDSCTDLLAACYGDGKGSKGCQQTFQCMTACKENQACSWNCLGQAAPQAVAKLDAFLDCYQAVCAPKCEGKGESCVNPCLVNECGTTFAACMSN